jgi:hypothetical protein
MPNNVTATAAFGLPFLPPLPMQEPGLEPSTTSPYNPTQPVEAGENYRRSYLWEEMTNIEKFDYLKTQFESLAYRQEENYQKLRSSFYTHSHDLAGRPCKPLEY